jgi:hypothetical protein
MLGSFLQFGRGRVTRFSNQSLGFSGITERRRSFVRRECGYEKSDGVASVEGLELIVSVATRSERLKTGANSRLGETIPAARRVLRPTVTNH